MAIDRKAVHLALADDIATQPLARRSDRGSGYRQRSSWPRRCSYKAWPACKERLGRAIDVHVDGQATGLKGDKGGERQEGV